MTDSYAVADRVFIWMLFWILVSMSMWYGMGKITVYLNALIV